MTWARWSVGETFRTLFYHNKHVSLGNLDDGVRATGRLPGFLAFMYVCVNNDLQQQKAQSAENE